MGMAGDDDVDTVHGFRQLFVLGQLRLPVGAGVGQADDKLRPLFFQGGNAPLRRLGGVLQGKAGGGGAVVGVHAHQAEDAAGDAAPLQKQGLLYAVTVHGLLNEVFVRVVGRGPVVGLQQGWERVAAVRRRVQHPGEAHPCVVKFMVAEGRRVIAHRAHGPQLGGLGGVEGLDQGADGEVAAVQQQGVGVLFPLPVNGSFQAGVAAGLAAILRRLGQEVGVEVMGKEDGGRIRGRRGIRRDHAEGTYQQKRQKQRGKTSFHLLILFQQIGSGGIPPLPILPHPTVCHNAFFIKLPPGQQAHFYTCTLQKNRI